MSEIIINNIDNNNIDNIDNNNEAIDFCAAVSILLWEIIMSWIRVYPSKSVLLNQIKSNPTNFCDTSRIRMQVSRIEKSSNTVGYVDK